MCNIALCTIRSRTVGMPRGRFSLLPGLSIITRRTARGSYRPSCSILWIRTSSSSACFSTASVVCPSIPGAPLRAVTVVNAKRKFFGDQILSLSVCHRLPSFPLSRAASIGSVQTSKEFSDSVNVPHCHFRVSPQCVAFSGTDCGVGVLFCSRAIFTFLPPFALLSLLASLLLWGLCQLPPFLLAAAAILT